MYLSQTFLASLLSITLVSAAPLSTSGNILARLAHNIEHRAPHTLQAITSAHSNAKRDPQNDGLADPNLPSPITGEGVTPVETVLSIPSSGFPAAGIPSYGSSGGSEPDGTTTVDPTPPSLPGIPSDGSSGGSPSDGSSAGASSDDGSADLSADSSSDGSDGSSAGGFSDDGSVDWSADSSSDDSSDGASVDTS